MSFKFIQVTRCDQRRLDRKIILFIQHKLYLFLLDQQLFLINPFFKWNICTGFVVKYICEQLSLVFIFFGACGVKGLRFIKCTIIHMYKIWLLCNDGKFVNNLGSGKFEN